MGERLVSQLCSGAGSAIVSGCSCFHDIPRSIPYLWLQILLLIPPHLYGRVYHYSDVRDALQDGVVAARPLPGVDALLARLRIELLHKDHEGHDGDREAAGGEGRRKVEGGRHVHDDIARVGGDGVEVALLAAAEAGVPNADEFAEGDGEVGRPELCEAHAAGVEVAGLALLRQMCQNLKMWVLTEMPSSPKRGKPEPLLPGTALKSRLQLFRGMSQVKEIH
jgi:hypothetical protein